MAPGKMINRNMDNIYGQMDLNMLVILKAQFQKGKEFLKMNLKLFLVAGKTLKCMEKANVTKLMVLITKAIGEMVAQKDKENIRHSKRNTQECLERIKKMVKEN